MAKFKDKYRIETTRLKGYDYSKSNWYYITINTKNHVCFFGKVINQKVVYNEVGKIAMEYWLQIPLHFNSIELDYFILMPNHIHGIIIIKKDDNIIEKLNQENNRNFFSRISPKKNSLSTIIRSYKSAVTRKIRNIGIENFEWQSRFYDRIIRNEKELFYIRKYIDENPLRWELEKNKPENLDFDILM